MRLSYVETEVQKRGVTHFHETINNDINTKTYLYMVPGDNVQLCWAALDSL